MVCDHAGRTCSGWFSYMGLLTTPKVKLCSEKKSVGMAHVTWKERQHRNNKTNKWSLTTGVQPSGPSGQTKVSEELPACMLLRRWCAVPTRKWYLDQGSSVPAMSGRWGQVWWKHSHLGVTVAWGVVGHESTEVGSWSLWDGHGALGLRWVQYVWIRRSTDTWPPPCVSA